MEPTINYDKITDAVTVGSCLRNAADAQKAREAGVAVVFSLQDASDLASQGIDGEAVAAACAAADVRHVAFPTSDTDEAVLRARLPAAVAAYGREVLAAAAAGGSAYVHCNGGRGRAPTIATAYLYWLAGQSLSQAVATMTNGRKSSPKLHVIEAATTDLLGAPGADVLTPAQRALISDKLAASL